MTRNYYRSNAAVQRVSSAPKQDHVLLSAHCRVVHAGQRRPIADRVGTPYDVSAATRTTRKIMRDYQLKNILHHPYLESNVVRTPESSKRPLKISCVNETLHEHHCTQAGKRKRRTTLAEPGRRQAEWPTNSFGDATTR